MPSGFDNAQPSWSAFRSNTFGYSRLIVHNHTHIRWQEVQTDPTLFPTAKYGSVIDDMWVIQNSHGPFAKDRAPKGTAWPVGDETPGRSFDHWAPLLGLDDGTGRSTSALIREFKQTHGEPALEPSPRTSSHTVSPPIFELISRSRPSSFSAHAVSPCVC